MIHHCYDMLLPGDSPSEARVPSCGINFLTYCVSLLVFCCPNVPQACIQCKSYMHISWLLHSICRPRSIPCTGSHAKNSRGQGPKLSTAHSWLAHFLPTLKAAELHLHSMHLAVLVANAANLTRFNRARTNMTPLPMLNTYVFVYCIK